MARKLSPETQEKLNRAQREYSSERVIDAARKLIGHGWMSGETVDEDAMMEDWLDLENKLAVYDEVRKETTGG